MSALKDKGHASTRGVCLSSPVQAAHATGDRICENPTGIWATVPN